jgi:hypothetical protein
MTTRENTSSTSWDGYHENRPQPKKPSPKWLLLLIPVWAGVVMLALFLTGVVGNSPLTTWHPDHEAQVEHTVDRLVRVAHGGGNMSGVCDMIEIYGNPEIIKLQITDAYESGPYYNPNVTSDEMWEELVTRC